MQGDLFPADEVLATRQAWGDAEGKLVGSCSVSVPLRNTPVPHEQLTLQREGQGARLAVGPRCIGWEILPNFEPSLAGTSRLGVRCWVRGRHVRREVLKQ